MTLTLRTVTRLVVLSLVCHQGVSAKKLKSNCEACELIVSNFQKGLKDTVKSNFGGGNTGWEEKSLGKWATSETRLIEILETICKEKDSECNLFFENNEEVLEQWYFNDYRDDPSAADHLRAHMCVEKTKVCCAENTYGPHCLPCPADEAGVCGGHGKCSGAGTREGTGKCRCDEGHAGDLCGECASGYFRHASKDGEDDKWMCMFCDASCEGGCSAAGPSACEKCKSGYDWVEEKGCQDVNECDEAEDPLCSDNEFCKNTVGSFTCGRCHSSCVGCTGDQAKDCTQCKDGYRMADVSSNSGAAYQECQDENECLYDACSSTANSRCVNTAGSYRCDCIDGHERKDDLCVPKVEDAGQEEEKAEKMEEKLEDRKKSEKVAKKSNSKGKSTKKSSAKPAKEKENPADKYTKGKHKYRTLDTMVLGSGTMLYLVMCLVFQAETLRTSAVTVVYALFLYKYCGQFL